MNLEEKIVVNFSLPFSAEKIFDFIILPKNMELYQGYGILPGIKVVYSSDATRKVGTLDRVQNTDGSSHESVTDVLERGKHYKLSLGNIQAVGYKKKIANPIVGFTEDWFFDPHGDHTHIERTLVVHYRPGFFNWLMVKYLAAWQLKKSFHRHHRALIEALGKKF